MNGLLRPLPRGQAAVTPTMIEPAQKDDRLLRDIATASADEHLLHVWWLGQSGFWIKHAGRSFLFDPYLSDSLTRKYAATDKPHVRMTARCVNPARLGAVEFATASHLHTDHLDAETLVPLAEAHGALRLFLPAAIEAEAATRLGRAPVQYVGLSGGDQYHDPHWTLEAVPAAHNDLKVNALGQHHCLGFLLDCGPFRIYHSGDTLWHDGLLAPLSERACDLMLLPINGNRPERRVAGNLSGPEAAALAKTCGARLVVPCHYDMFTFNTESPEAFAAECRRLGQPYRVLGCGERLTLQARAGADTPASLAGKTPEAA